MHYDVDDLYTTGIFEYTDINNTDGSISKELLRVNEGKLEKLVPYTTSVYVSTGVQGPNPIGSPHQFGVYSNFKLDETTNTFKFTIASSFGELKTVDLGTGYNVGDMTISQLISAMQNVQIPIAKANGTFTVSDVVTVPAGVRFNISNFIG